MSTNSKPFFNSCSDNSRNRPGMPANSPRVWSSPNLEGLRREKEEIEAKCKRTAEKLAQLKEKYAVLEREHGELLLKKLETDEQFSKLRREIEVKEVEIERLESDVRVLADREARANRRYGKMVVEIERIGREKVQIDMQKAYLIKENRGIEMEKKKVEDMAEEYLEEVKKVEREKDEKIEELMVNIEALEAEKMKLQGQAKRVEAERNEIQRVLKEQEDLKQEKRKVDIALEHCLAEAERREREKDKEIEELKTKNEGLELEKRKREAELVNWFEKSRRVEKEKDEVIDGLVKRNENLEVEKHEVEKKYEMLEKKVLKLEEDVVTYMYANVSTNEALARSPIGKILFAVSNALDAEESGYTRNVPSKEIGNVQDEVFLKEKSSSHTGAPKFSSIIQICDSDDNDDDDMPLATRFKRMRYSSSKSNDMCNAKDTARKTEINKDGMNEPATRTPSAETLRHWEQNNATEDGVVTNNDFPSSGGVRSCCGARVKLYSPEFGDFFPSRGKRRGDKRLGCEADMNVALDKDLELCMHAVCALYRQHMQRDEGDRLLISGYRGFRDCDAFRGIALAQFLIAGDPNRKLKKSVAELKQYDERGPDDCRKLTVQYYRQLFEIYQKNEDPLFCPSSFDLAYS